MLVKIFILVIRFFISGNNITDPAAWLFNSLGPSSRKPLGRNGGRGASYAL